MLEHVRRFWRQPNRRYRDFQIVFSLLTLNFVVPAVTYSLAPQVAMDQFLAVNDLLGGDPYVFPETGSRVWRYLGAANVMTLGLMCLLLQLNLVRFFPVLVPLTFMKLYAATHWLGGWFADPGAMFFLAAAVLDYATSTAFVFFAVRARRALRDPGDEELVPPPQGLGGLGRGFRT